MCLGIVILEGTRASRSRRSRFVRRLRLFCGRSAFVSEVNPTLESAVSNNIPQVNAGGCFTMNRVIVTPKISNGL
jgi:hypothetical protein